MSKKNAYTTVKEGFPQRSNEWLICLCSEVPVVDNIGTCQKCGKPTLESMNMGREKAMTLAMMHDGMIAPQRMQAVIARYERAKR